MGTPEILTFRKIVEAAGGFAAEVAGGDVFFEQGAGAVFGVAEAFVEDVHDVHADVEADEVGEFERAHRMVHAELHDGVDGFGRGDAFHDGVGGFVDQRHEDAVGDEAGGVVDGDGGFAEFFAELHREVESGVAGLQRADDFDERHHRDGIHEVHADEAVGALGHGGEGGHGDRGGVAGDDDVVAQEAVGFGEGVALDVELFGDGFDEEVGVGDGGHVGDGDDAGEDGSLFAFGELAFFDFAIEIFGDGVDAAIEDSAVRRRGG